MDLHVERFIRYCVQCALSERVAKPKVQPVVIRERPEGPWKEVGLDIVGPILSLGSEWYVLVDLFSRWREITITRGIETKHVKACL